ncbi:AMP-binding protein [Mycobacterium paraintracellulare]|uniref:AMP-binding protein n=1 Tax=Mycobacterium paraintracellulare TaxID=1138383 RepID=UPI0019256111|nr:AMP-binding protein [Mycobacterium paraintracellulare]BCP14237.1 2,3-dihydroxybenzoate-AMP ligase [Mycobacterium paraintracellulare]
MSLDDQSRSDIEDFVPFPPDLVAQYRQRGLWSNRTISESLHASATDYPRHPAVMTPDQAERLSYAELDRRTDEVAFGLHQLGLRAGERVLLQLGNQAITVVAWYGLLKAGLVPIATLPHHREHELFEIARQAEPAAHIVDIAFPSNDLRLLARNTAAAQPSVRVRITVNADIPCDDEVALESLGAGVSADAARCLVETIQRDIDPDSVAVLQLSGGTTSIPKLIPRLHAEYWYNAEEYARAIELTEDSCVAHVLPVVHNAGIVCGVHAAHAVGACFATCRHDAEQLQLLADRCQPTHLFMAPPVAQMVLERPQLRHRVQGVDVVVWTLGKIPQKVREAFETSACRIQQLYGQGEGLCMVTPADASIDIRHNTVGIPISPLDEVRIYAPGTEEPVDPGTPGELCCRGPYTTRGYFRGGPRNREAFTTDGFYRTGDIAVEIVADGRSLYAIEDRLKDVISRGGEKINALEVEGLLAGHPAIRAAALVAMPDERLGERACAFIVPADGAQPLSLEDLKVYLNYKGVAKFKWPERIEIRYSLPVNSTDKVNKALLRNEIAELLARQHTPR